MTVVNSELTTSAIGLFIVFFTLVATH